MIISIFDQVEQLTYDATKDKDGNWIMAIDGYRFDCYLTRDVLTLARQCVAPIA
jgi:hypothetical protein